MLRKKSTYRCQQCGSYSPKWLGQCPDCGEWNTFEEVVKEEVTGDPSLKKGWGVTDNPSGYAGLTQSTVYSLTSVPATPEIRTPTGLLELDRVLGGGLVKGSVVLIGGDPGIGKSTLLLQALAHLSQVQNTLYVTGEESPQQVSMRAQRLSLEVSALKLLTEIQIERILASVQQQQTQVLVIDSIQTVYTEDLNSAPGSVTQVRECAALLVRYAKQYEVTMFLIGHVTKEGALAGPRVLEHMVDTVLYFEGDSSSPYRMLRAIKNRFGAVNELGIFGMTGQGLKEVANPSAIFLSHHAEEAAGSVVLVSHEGSRPLLVEVQTLVNRSHLPTPRRVTLGLESNRLSMLLAVLYRQGNIVTHDQDVFVNVVGGVRISETGADLAVLLAILSSLRNQPLPKGLVVFGEVGLTGEIRPVPNGLVRLKEAAKHGFDRAIIPKLNLPREAVPELNILAVSRLTEALQSL